MGDSDKFSSGKSMELFRAEVISAFGRNLEKATPANVRLFLENFQSTQTAEKVQGRVILNETKTTYEEILKDFFMNVLDKPSEEAVIILWAIAFEMSFFLIEQHAGDRLSNLFGDHTEGNPSELV